MSKNFVNDPNMPEFKEKANDKLDGSHGAGPVNKKTPGFYSTFLSRACKEFKNAMRLKTEEKQNTKVIPMQHKVLP